MLYLIIDTRWNCIYFMFERFQIDIRNVILKTLQRRHPLIINSSIFGHARKSFILFAEKPQSSVDLDPFHCLPRSSPLIASSSAVCRPSPATINPRIDFEFRYRPFGTLFTKKFFSISIFNRFISISTYGFLMCCSTCSLLSGRC